MTEVWCVCGHSYEDHMNELDSKTEEILQSFCVGIDGHDTHQIIPNEKEHIMTLTVTCPCEKFTYAEMIKS